MPRYFFHCKRGQVTVLDHEGIELADIEDAEREARRRAKEVGSREAASSGSRAIVVADDWHTLLEVRF